MDNYNNFIVGYARSKIKLLYAYNLAMTGVIQGIVATKQLTEETHNVCMLEQLCQNARNTFEKELKSFELQLNGTICYNEDTYRNYDAMMMMAKRHLEILKNIKNSIIPDENDTLSQEMHRYEAVLRAFLSKTKIEQLEKAV